MYHIYVTYTAKPGTREEFLEQIAALGLRQAVLAEEGCLGYDYYRAVDNPDQVLLVERWESPAHQQAHLNQPHMQALPGLKERYILDTSLERYEL